MEKIIHYCWFGGKPLPKLAKKCIKSWKKYLPDYEIIRWDESNFDVNITSFSKEAYKCKKWAFVSDVARIYALKKYGGIYFDTDMLLTKKIDFLLDNDFFVGWESKDYVAVGVLGAKKANNDVVNELFNVYKDLAFNEASMYVFTIPKILTKLLIDKYKLEKDYTKNQLLAGNIHVYAKDYFYPINFNYRGSHFTNNTCMIHYYSASWIPKGEKRNLELYRIVGEKKGDLILKILRVFKNMLRIGIKIFLYPSMKIREQVINNKKIIEIERTINEANKQIKKKDYIVIHNSKWLGTTYATKELFENLIALPEINVNSHCKRIAQNIYCKSPKLVIFSGFAIGWGEIAKILKQMDKNIIIKVIWHGSNSLHIEDYDWVRFNEIIKLHNDKIINGIGFVKKSMADFYKLKGYNAEFIMNNVCISKKQDFIKKQQESNEVVKIGLYASSDRWVKNFYNQLSGASLVPNAIVDCVPANGKTYEFAEMIGLNIIGYDTHIPREELLKRISNNDVNLYVTFTECAPMLPLESLELGVPCITSNNHHYWENHELRKYLVVDEADNVIAIYDKIMQCLTNKELIMKLYKDWKKDYNKEVKNNISLFIRKGD